MIAVVTAKAARGLDDDEVFLSAALDHAGIGYRAEAWDDPEALWDQYELVVVRSPWDYAARRAEFLEWSRHVAAVTTIVNPPEVLRWSTDKHYLLDLAARGVPTVPTIYIAVGETIAIDRGDVVVKPAVGAGSADCGRHRDRADAEAHARALLEQGRAVLIQPYVSAVDDHGETALVYFDGRFSHAIRKGPILAAPIELVGGLFAREDISPRDASDVERAVAEMALGAVPFAEPLLYARVDLVPGRDGPLVLEVELCEPSLFFGHDTGAAERFVEALTGRLGRTQALR